jgi:putative phage-type endonuclease
MENVVVVPIKSKVRKLQKIFQPVQRSPEWFEMRKDKITASSAASLLIRDEKTCGNYVKIFDLSESFMDNKAANPYSSKKDYILTKCGFNKFSGSTATYWGTMLEQVATDIYCRRAKTDIIEFGLLPHSSIDYLAASPDGITPDGVMLEIKCPYRRKITGIPPFYYYVQMQLQLEVADLKRCDFLECEFIELQDLEHYTKTKIIGEEEKGIILEMRPKSKKDRSESEYVYPETYEKNLEEWSEKKISKFKNTSTHDIFRVYWKLVKYSVVRVKRDKEWFANVLPVLKAGWDEVMYYKENGCDSLIKPPKPELKVITFDDIDASGGKSTGPNETGEIPEYLILSDSE